ncbi:MAG: DUF1569 domain-containing protein [Bacteroidia bacterium]
MFIQAKTEAGDYLDRLAHDAKPLWGNMNAQQMVEHLLFVLEVVTVPKEMGEILTPAEKIPRVQAFLMSDKPMPRDFQAPAIANEAIAQTRFPDFETAKIALKEGINAFFSYFEANPDAIHAHLVFGHCNAAQWEMLQNKHFTHHFTQFGLLPTE